MAAGRGSRSCASTTLGRRRRSTSLAASRQRRLQTSADRGRTGTGSVGGNGGGIGGGGISVISACGGEVGEPLRSSAAVFPRSPRMLLSMCTLSQ